MNLLHVLMCMLRFDEYHLGLQEFLQRLTLMLRQYPPPQPKKPAVDLLVAVGDQQLYLDMNGLLPPPESDASLDALQVMPEISSHWQGHLCKPRRP